MGNSQPQATTRSGSGREIALLVGVLLLVGVGSVATYWMRARSGDAVAEASSTQQGPASAPAGPRVAAPAPTRAEVVHADVYFDFKSTRLRAEAARLLQDTAATMEGPGTWAVLVQGHADRQGPAGYNRLLAERRAGVVKQFLVELGVPESAVKVVTIGPEGALCEDPTEECAQLNRRVHLEVRRLAGETATPGATPSVTPQSGALSRPDAAAEPLRPALLVGDVLDTTAGQEQHR